MYRRESNIEQFNLRVPLKTYMEIRGICSIDRRIRSPQDFIRDAVMEEVQKWKIENEQKIEELHIAVEKIYIEWKEKRDEKLRREPVWR